MTNLVAFFPFLSQGEILGIIFCSLLPEIVKNLITLLPSGKRVIYRLTLDEVSGYVNNSPALRKGSAVNIVK